MASLKDVRDLVSFAPTDTERRNFCEIGENAIRSRSTALTSQLPVMRRHEQIGDPTAAESTVDGLVQNTHRNEMRGDSMQKKCRKDERLALKSSARGPLKG